MLYIRKIDDYLTILIDDEVKDFEILVNRPEYNCSCRFETSEEQNLGKFTELLYIFSQNLLINTLTGIILRF